MTNEIKPGQIFIHKQRNDPAFVESLLNDVQVRGHVSKHQLINHLLRPIIVEMCSERFVAAGHPGVTPRVYSRAEFEKLYELMQDALPDFLWVVITNDHPKGNYEAGSWYQVRDYSDTEWQSTGGTLIFKADAQRLTQE